MSNRYVQNQTERFYFMKGEHLYFTNVAAPLHLPQNRTVLHTACGVAYNNSQFSPVLGSQHTAHTAHTLPRTSHASGVPTHNVLDNNTTHRDSTVVLVDIVATLLEYTKTALSSWRVYPAWPAWPPWPLLLPCWWCMRRKPTSTRCSPLRGRSRTALSSRNGESAAQRVL